MRMSTNKNEHSIHYIVECIEMYASTWMSGRRKEHRNKIQTNMHSTHSHTERERIEAGTSERTYICMSFLVKLMKNQQQWLFYTYFSVVCVSLNGSEWASKPANEQGFERNGTIEKARQNIKTLKRFNWSRVCEFESVQHECGIVVSHVMSVSFLAHTHTCSRVVPVPLFLLVTLSLSISFPLLFWECLSWRFF